jgi:hypothetical protein
MYSDDQFKALEMIGQDPDPNISGPNGLSVKYRLNPAVKVVFC